MPLQISAEEQVCYIHTKVQLSEIKDIHESVCVKEFPYKKHIDGKHYCLFHFPGNEKDLFMFKTMFNKRLKLITERVVEFESLPEIEKRKAILAIYYDFRYVWFPLKVILAGYKFEAKVNFSHATFNDNAVFNSTIFSAHVNFTSATFLHNVDFYSTKFSSRASFGQVIFSAKVRFTSADFSSQASFDRVTFWGKAEFNLVNFNNHTSFSSTKFLGRALFNSANFKDEVFFTKAAFFAKTEFNTTTFANGAFFASVYFSSHTDFRSAKFLETSQIFFDETKFCRKISFRQTIFEGYVVFKGGSGEKVFLNKKHSLEIKKQQEQKLNDLEQKYVLNLQFNNPDKYREAVLDFQNARLENPERISFHRVRLFPNWFVNVDSRKMVFTDVDWENTYFVSQNANIIAEIENLEKRNFSEPTRLLEITCRQLSINAEENNRFEEASNFRLMAFETERLMRREKQIIWWSEEISCLQIFLRFWQKIVNAPFDFLHFLYRLLSGYGEKWFRAFCWLIFIWVAFAFFYAFLGTFGTEEKQVSIEFLKSLGYSLQVMTLQKPEPRPYDWVTYLFYGFETILAPLQAALLALAIRRKFMR